MTDKEQTQGLEEMATEVADHFGWRGMSRDQLIQKITEALRQAQADALERADAAVQARETNWRQRAARATTAEAKSIARVVAQELGVAATAIRAMKEGECAPDPLRKWMREFGYSDPAEFIKMIKNNLDGG